VLRTSTLTRTQRERRSSSSTDSSLISASLRSNEATNAKPGAFSRVWTGSLNIIGRANDWKKSSRFHGWQWGVFTGACVGTIVLLLNIIFAIIPLASQHGYEQGVATLFVDTSTKIETWNSLLHVLINVLSTLLLSASNYAMQVLCAPTRSQCINAHMSGKTIDIGVFSFRNVTSISGKRRLLWITLALSSVPLHLL
jgi:hypothetical protein